MLNLMYVFEDKIYVQSSHLWHHQSGKVLAKENRFGGYHNAEHKETATWLKDIT